MQFIRMMDLAKTGREIKEDVIYPYAENQIAAYFLTGATTSQFPKCVQLYADTEYQTGQVAVAFLVFKEGCTVSEKELQKLCADNLPEYYLVSRCVFVKEFPYTSASKVDYRKLEEMAEKTNE